MRNHTTNAGLFSVCVGSLEVRTSVSHTATQAYAHKQLNKAPDHTLILIDCEAFAVGVTNLVRQTKLN